MENIEARAHFRWEFSFGQGRGSVMSFSIQERDLGQKYGFGNLDEIFQEEDVECKEKSNE